MFNDFLEWYGTRRVRLTGRPAAPSTLRTKASHLSTVCRVLALTDERDISTITSDRVSVVRLLEALYSQLSPGTVRNVATTLREYGEWAVLAGHATECALQASDTPGKNPRKVVHVYSRDEMDLLVSSARGMDRRLWAFLALLADTGRRVGEALAVEYAWLRLDAEPAHIILATTKSGRQNLVPLGRRLREEVFTPENLAYFQAEPGRWAQDPAVRLFPWRYSTVERRTHRLCNRIGMEWRGFHRFRHSRATELLASGAPLQAVSRLLGHESVTTTARVYDWTDGLSFASWAQ